MDLSAKVLGAHAVDALTTQHRDHVLTIGKDKFTRGDLAHVECFNFVAARNLAAACAALGVKDTRELYDTVPPSALALPRVGTIALAVLGAAFEHKGVGGDAPLETWARKHGPKIVTFDTIKAREKHSDADQRAKRRTKGKRR